MTTPRSVSHVPLRGEFWAWRNPLSLICIKHVEDSQGGPSTVSARQWAPTKEDDLFVFGLSSDHAEFLWWEQMILPYEPLQRAKPLLAGDILIARTSFADGRIEDGRLFFIGPETDPGGVIHVLASWEVCDFDLTSPVYQYGPGHLATIGKTAYDHVLEGAL
jgi:hypothetical protein